ncbi:MAG: SDR family NAD(P)-dependent oxidoreductase [Alphaproteobacteria bacterium]|jgi:NAD(P)-dependent dehydrogenase (short-subunit alcohol dehydrogenase family)|nr:SDR family NAD(P)-dependent oxidoreductase [Alphaproteobacteria bacterium]
MSEPDLSGRVVLITGASRGFGRAVATALAPTGAHLILTARTQGALEELDDEIRAAGHGEPTLAPLDLTDHDAVNGLGAGIMARFRRLDGLVHAAGALGVLSPVAHVKPEVMTAALELQVGVTHRLIASLDLPLRQSPAGRAVFVTCGHGRDGRAYWGAFAAPRAAAEVLVAAYAAESRKTALAVNLFDPGPMATRLRRDAYPGEAPDAQPDPAAVAPELLPLLAPTWTRSGERISAAAR